MRIAVARSLGKRIGLDEGEAKGAIPGCSQGYLLAAGIVLKKAITWADLPTQNMSYTHFVVVYYTGEMVSWKQI